MPKNLQGYSYGTDRNSNITHNLFLDDLKLHASNINILKKQQDLVAVFSVMATRPCFYIFYYTGMTFGEQKCAYWQVENGKIIQNTEHLDINGDTFLCIQTMFNSFCLHSSSLKFVFFLFNLILKP